MIELYESLPDLYKTLLGGITGLILGWIATYTNEKVKQRALKDENAKLVQETEDIKSKFTKELEELKKDHQLDISKRKYRYESKKASYINFFQKLDTLNSEINQKSSEKMREMLEKFTLSCINSKSDEEYNDGIIVFQNATQSILMDSHQDIIKLKHETSEIKLHASDEIISNLNKLESAYEKLINESNLLIQKMPAIILSADSNLMELSQENLKNEAAETESIKNDLIQIMRKELDEI